MPQPNIERSLPKIERSRPKNDGVLKDSDSDPNSDSESDSEESSDSGSKAPRLTVDVGKLFKGSFTLQASMVCVKNRRRMREFVKALVEGLGGARSHSAGWTSKHLGQVERLKKKILKRADDPAWKKSRNVPAQKRKVSAEHRQVPATIRNVPAARPGPLRRLRLGKRGACCPSLQLSFQLFFSATPSLSFSL